MKKIVELKIDQEELEFEGLGVDIMSLVDNPAIGIEWQAFSEQEFVNPNPGEAKDDFISRCIPVIIDEGYDQDQASAICYASWDNKFYVDNKGFETFDKWFTDNQDIFKKPGGGAAGEGGVNHGEQMKLLAEAGIDTGYPFGYCFQVAQFLFYAVGGYNSEWNLKLIKGMEYQVGGVDFKSTHWYIQNNDGRIVDLTASQFDGILDLDDYYGKGRNGNLGYPYYNVDGKQVVFENTVPSLQSLKMYDKWRDENGTLEVLETYYTACKYEELRKAFSDEDDMVRQMILDLASSDEFGEEYDEDVIIVDGTKENFANIGDWLKGVQALDILGKRIKQGQSETKYRYGGPRAERNFCKAMQRLQKLYTKDEIKEMGLRVGNGMPVYGSSANNILNWKGGPNCKHYWEEVQVFKKDGRTAMMISKGAASGEMGTANSSRLDKGYKMSFQFANEDERIIVGPAMIPQQLIARRDALGNLFHVYFSKETIKKIAEKFLKENKHNNTDVNHNDDVKTTNTLLESWIVEDPKMDKSAKYGYSLPEGAWMVSYKINDDETWNKIKDGSLKGFSIAGNFIEKAIKKS